MSLFNSWLSDQFCTALVHHEVFICHSRQNWATVAMPVSQRFFDSLASGTRVGPRLRSEQKIPALYFNRHIRRHQRISPSDLDDPTLFVLCYSKVKLRIKHLHSHQPHFVFIVLSSVCDDTLNCNDDHWWTFIGFGVRSQRVSMSNPPLAIIATWENAF